MPQSYVLENGKEILATLYWQERNRQEEEARIKRLIENLTPNAKRLYDWWRNRKNPIVTLVEISKCLTPPKLRKVAIIRLLTQELLDGGLIESVGPFRQRGVWRKEVWRLLQQNNS